MIHQVERIEINGLVWFAQEFDNPDGNLETVNLYDKNGWFVAEFNNYEDMMRFINEIQNVEY